MRTSITSPASRPRSGRLACPIHLHRDDQFLYDHAVQSGAMFGLQVEPQPPIDVYYTPGEVIAFGGYEVRPHHTPGHCPGGVCLQIGRKGEAGKELFVGDTLFAGSIGRTDLPGGDFDDAHRLDPQRPVRVRRRRDRPSGARAGHDHRPGTAHQPFSAERLTAEHAESAVADHERLF